MAILTNSSPTTRPNGGAGPLRRGLDTLRVKLFLAIAGAHLVLVLAVYLIYSWSFDKGLVDYVNQSEQARLDPVISQLADGYRENGNWLWVTQDRERWFDVLREVLGWRVGRRENYRSDWNDRNRTSTEERVPRSFEGDTGPLPPLTIDWRLMLFDAEGRVLILPPGGEPEDAQLAVKLPIRLEGELAGYLGYVPRLRLVQSLESITARQQSQRFGVIGIGMLAA